MSEQSAQIARSQELDKTHPVADEHPTASDGNAPQKRQRDVDGDGDEEESHKDRKKMCGSMGEPMAAPSSTSSPPQSPDPQAIGVIDGKAMTSKKDPHTFYPHTYDTFDPSCVVVDGDPQNSKQGGGKMLFIKYMDKSTGVMRPLRIQTPLSFLPVGITEFQSKPTDAPGPDKGGKAKPNTSALCSLGKSWESNPNMVAFRGVIDKLTGACVRLIMNKGLNEPYCKTEESVNASMVPFITTAEKPDKDDPTKLTVFPPGFKLSIKTAPNNRSILTMKTGSIDGVDQFMEIPFQSVTKGSSMAASVHFDWVYRRKRSVPNGWAYSLHASVHEAIVIPPGDGDKMQSSRPSTISVFV